MKDIRKYLTLPIIVISYYLIITAMMLCGRLSNLNMSFEELLESWLDDSSWH